jgi:hypothetical protein
LGEVTYTTNPNGNPLQPLVGQQTSAPHRSRDGSELPLQDSPDGKQLVFGRLGACLWPRESASQA